MKNNVKDYKGLSEEDKKFLREFDDAVERGYFKDELVKIPQGMKKSIDKERKSFKRDIMFQGKRSGGNVDGIIQETKPYVGRKKTKVKRDNDGKFTAKDVK